METPETQDVWKECDRKLIQSELTGCLRVLVVCAPLVIALKLLTNLDWKDSVLVFNAALLPFAGYLLVKRRSSSQKQLGEIIWDFGRLPGREIWVILAYMGFIVATISLIGNAILYFQGDEFALDVIVYPLVGSGYFYVIVSGKLLVCSNGIWAYHKFRPWDTLVYFEWKPSDEWKHSSLWLKVQHCVRGPRKVIIIIPDEYKERVEELLRQHLPPASNEAEENAKAEAETHPV